MIKETPIRETKHIAYMCAFRRRVPSNTSLSLDDELLLTRTGFWDNEHNRPRDFAGEWMFPYACYKPGDQSFGNTACRAFREQLSYQGSFRGLSFLYSFADPAPFDAEYHDEYYAAQVDDDVFTLPENGVLLEYRWVPISAARALITSDAFSDEQNRAFKEHGLNDDCFGPYALFERLIPLQMFTVLSVLYQSPGRLVAVPADKKGL